MELLHIYTNWLYRWPTGAVTKKSIKTKTTIFQEPLVEIDPILCQNVFFFLHEAILIFLSVTISNLCKLTVQDVLQRPLLKKHKHENGNISRTIG